MATTKKIIVPRVRFQYAAKFICISAIPGTSNANAFMLPGNYQTVINIHNPWTKPVKYRRKLASAIGISEYKWTELKPDGVETITCENMNMFDLHFIHGFEGFLVVESPASLDVTAVYMAGDKSVNSIDVDAVKERKI